MIGLLGGFVLYTALGSVVGVLTAIVEGGMGFPPNTPTYQSAHFEISVGSITWMLAWCVGSAACWRFLKPVPKFWTLPFFLATCWAWFGIALCDGPRDAVAAEFEPRMFIACAVVTVIGVIRMILGEGRQQTATLKRIVGIPVSDEQSSPTLPKDMLLRASSLSEVSHQTLLRPVKETMETPPEELLRASQPKDL